MRTKLQFLEYDEEQAFQVWQEASDKAIALGAAYRMVLARLDEYKAREKTKKWKP